MSVVEVRISFSGNQFITSKNPVTLSKKAGNTVKWYNDTSAEIEISFDAGSPFSAKDYVIPTGKQKDSGSIQVDADTTWKYSISGSGIITDPEIVIQP